MANTARRLLRIILIVFIALVVGALMIHFAGPLVIIKTSTKVFKAYRNIERGDLAKTNVEYDSLFIQTKDSLLLRGFLIYTPEERQKGTIIFLHGIRASKEIFVDISEKLAGKGYNSVIFDLRAHGESEGKYCTFGFKEKYDVVSLLDSLDKKEISRNYGVWGQSLGGAVALQSLEIEPRLKFGVIESTFSCYQVIVHDYVKYNLKFNIEPVTDYLIDRTEKLGQFNADGIHPAESARNVYQPVVVAHGEVDNRIDNRYGKEIFEKLASEKKKFILVDSAKHSNVWSVGGEEYFERILSFITNFK